MLELKQEKIDDIVLLTLEGQLDALTVGTIRPVMDQIVNSRASRVIFDLGGLTLVDSSGVGALVALLKSSRSNGGDAKIVNLSRQPREIFRVLKLDEAFGIFDTIDQAVQALKSSQPRAC